jgi:hypothetical protein
MTDLDVDDLVLKAVALIKTTPEDRMGNGKLRDLLKLNEDLYDQVKQVILDQGLATSGRGRGGSLVLSQPRAAQAVLPPPPPPPEEALPPHVQYQQQAQVASTRKPPFQVSGRDYGIDDLIKEDVVKAFEHRPYNNRNEYCIEVFDALRHRNLTYPGIRIDRQEVEKAMREGRNINTDIMVRIHDNSNRMLETIGLALEHNIGIVRDTPDN